MILYNLKDGPNNDFIITKFDDDMNVESSYNVSQVGCTCPQGHKPVCRHRKMLPLMVDRLNSAWFYCFDDKQWYDPTGLARFEQVEEAKAKVEANAPAPDLTNSLPKLTGLQEEQILMGFHQPELCEPPLEPTKLRRLR